MPRKPVSDAVLKRCCINRHKQRFKMNPSTEYATALTGYDNHFCDLEFFCIFVAGNGALSRNHP